METNELETYMYRNAYTRCSIRGLTLGMFLKWVPKEKITFGTQNYSLVSTQTFYRVLVYLGIIVKIRQGMSRINWLWLWCNCGWTQVLQDYLIPYIQRKIERSSQSYILLYFIHIFNSMKKYDITMWLEKN